VYAVITENDESQWSDETGSVYHYPKRYANLLAPGAKVVYYKGKLKKQEFAGNRLSSSPHYFGFATVGKIYADKKSQKGDLFATIEGFRAFTTPLLARTPDGRYVEPIPANRVSNYWRDGVRAIDEATYQRLVASAEIAPEGTIASSSPSPRSDEGSDDLESWVEGSRTMKFVSVYERDARYRRQALAIHGYRCVVCEKSMEDIYGDAGKNFIHVHHLVPVSTFERPRAIDPEKELVPVCPNCHAIIHRGKRGGTMSIDEVRQAMSIGRSSSRNE